MSDRSSFRAFLAALVFFALHFASSALGAESIADAKLDDDGRTLTVKIGDNQTRFTAPEGKYYDHLVLSGDKQRAFVALKRGSRTRGSWHENIQEFSLADFSAQSKAYKLREIPLVTDLDEASVSEIFSASQDGLRLLVSVHHVSRRSGADKLYKQTFYRQYPYFFDTRTGKITMVAP